jgi:hypothetical protein
VAVLALFSVIFDMFISWRWLFFLLGGASVDLIVAPSRVKKLRLGGIDTVQVLYVTIACDGGPGAQAAWGRCYRFVHRDRRETCRPNRAPGNTHRGLDRFCESRPVQLAASHLVRAEASVGCRGRGRTGRAEYL